MTDMEKMADKGADKAQSAQNILDLWKAIHGGCWPGPPLDLRLSRAVQEVMAGLALHNLAAGFSDAAIGQQVRKVAAASLEKSLPNLGAQIKG